MSLVLLGTDWVSEDEPCYVLREEDAQAPDGKGFHRYQIAKVMRGDKLVEFRKDMGLSVNFTGEPVAIVGGCTDPETGRMYIEETFGSLLEVLQRVRGQYGYEAPERPKPTDLVDYYHTIWDRQEKQGKALSTFGAAGKIQRS